MVFNCNVVILFFADSVWRQSLKGEKQREKKPAEIFAFTYSVAGLDLIQPIKGGYL